MGKTLTPYQWPTLPTAELARHSTGDVETPTAEAIEAARTSGLPDPLYVIRTEDGGHQAADDHSRALLTVALAAELETVPVTPRPVVRVSALTPHPDNARTDYHLDADFIESLRTEGCVIPVLIQRTQDGTLQVNDGNRRYYGAQKAGLTHVPYAWDERTTADQHLQMVTTAQHSQHLSLAEEASALFAAHEAGAPLARVAKVARRTQKDTRKVLRIGASDTARKAASGSHTSGWTLEDYARLEALEQQDAGAAAEVAEKAASGDGWSARIALNRAEAKAKTAAELAAHRAELEAAGARFRDADELSDYARSLGQLGISEDDHAACQGHVWVLWESVSQTRYTPFCANARLHGHISDADVAQAAQSKEAARAARRAVREGNLDWDAAERTRRDWLAQHVQRRNHKRAELDSMLTTVTRAMYDVSEPFAAQMHKGNEICAELLGLPQNSTRDDLEKAAATDAKRMPVRMFARWAAAHETQMRRDVWRTDDQRNPWSRAQCRRYLATLRDEYGYQPTAIEAAVIADEPYQPVPQAETVTAENGQDQMPDADETPAE